MDTKTKKIETSLEEPRERKKNTKGIPKKNTKGINVLGANQYLLDPRQELCWSYYVDPRSETFSNAYRSAIKAGYKKSHSLHITGETWWSERVIRIGMLAKAEKVLNDTLDMDHVVPAIGAFGPILDKDGNQLLKSDMSILRIKQDSAKFIAETQGKKKGYSKKIEVDVDPGEKMLSIFNESQLQTIARGLLNGGTPSAA